MKKKTDGLTKRLLSLALAFVMVFGITMTTDLFHIKDTKEASAAQLSVTGTSAIAAKNFPSVAPGNNFVFLGNEWYVLQQKSGVVTFIDSDANINGAISSTWDNRWNAIKSKESIFTSAQKSVIAKRSDNYLFVPSKDELGNNAVAGRVYSKAGNFWTDTVCNDNRAWDVNNASGGVAFDSRSYAYRVAPAFNLNLEQIHFARSASSLQNFGAYNQIYFTVSDGGTSADFTSSTVYPIVKSDYATQFEMATIKDKILVGYNGVYNLPYTNAEASGYIVATLYNTDGTCAYDGKLLEITDENRFSGSAKLDLSGVKSGKYTLMLQEITKPENGTDGLSGVLDSKEYGSTPIYATLNVLPSTDDTKNIIVRSEAKGELPSSMLHEFMSEDRVAEYMKIDNSVNALEAETDVITDEDLVLGQTYTIPVSKLNTTAPGKGKTKYVSAIIYDDANAPIYYGKLDYVLEDNDATVKLTVPTDLDKAVTYKLALFEETASTGDDDTCSTPVTCNFHVTYKSVTTGGSTEEVGEEWQSDTQNGIVWYYKLDKDLNVTNVWTKDAPDNIIDDTGCMNIPATIGKNKYPVVSIGGGTADTTFVPKSYNGYNSITFPATCTKINKFAFSECKAALNLTIPAHMRVIDQKAFYKASYMRNVTIKGAGTAGSDDKLVIGKRAFAKCTNLQSFIDVGNNVEIGEQAFTKCPSLSKVSLFEDVTIGEYAFAECTGLTSLKMDLMTGTIAGHAFENCDTLPSVFIPNTIKTAEPYAFNDCDQLANVEFDMDVLGSQIFANCDMITKLILDKNVTSVDSNWGGYNETASEGSIQQGGNTNTSNASNSERSIYVFNRNTEFNFDKDANGDFYSSFGVKRSNSETKANHNFYRATKIYYITLKDLPEDFNDIDRDGANTTPRQEKTVAEASATVDGGTVHLCTGVEDIAKISVSGCGELKAGSDNYAEDSVSYLLTAHQACQLVGEPNDASTNRISYSAFISNDYSQATKQVGIEASYPASVDSKGKINKSSFTVYPTYNDGTPYKAVYAPEQFTIVNADTYEAMKTAEETKDLFADNGALKISSRDAFIEAVGDDSTINPIELSEDATTGTQAIKVLVFTDVDDEKTLFEATVNVTITKKASDFDSLVNEYGSVAAVMMKISDLQADITTYKASIITATNDLWHSIGVTDKDSTTSMTNSQITDNFNAAVAAAKKAGTDVGEVTAELTQAKADLAEMTTQYSEVVKQLNAMLGKDNGETTVKPGDFVRVTEDGKKQVYVDGVWYDIKDDGDPTSPDGAVIEKEIEKTVTKEDGTTEVVKETVEVTVKIDSDKISTSYKDPQTDETVTDSYSTELQNMIRVMTAQLADIQKQLSEMNAQLTKLENALGIAADAGASTEERVDAILTKIEQMKEEYNSLAATNAAISAEYDKVIDKVYGENKPETVVTADAINAKIDGIIADRVNEEVQKALANNDAATAATTALQSKLTATIKEILASGNPDLGGSGLTEELIAALNEVKDLQAKVASLQTAADAQAEFLTTMRAALSLDNTADASAILASVQSLKDKIAELTVANETLIAENASLKAQIASGGAVTPTPAPSDDTAVDTSSINYKTGYSAGQTAGYNSGYAKGLSEGKASTTANADTTAIQYLNSQLTTANTQLKSAQAENTSLTAENKELTTQVNTLSSGIEELYNAIPVAGLNSVGNTTALTTKLSKVKTYLSTVAVTNTNLAKKNQTLEKKVDTLEAKNDALTVKNEKLETKNDALKAKNQTLTAANKSLASTNQSLQASVKAAANKPATTYTAPQSTSTNTTSSAPAASTQNTSGTEKSVESTTAVRSTKSSEETADTTINAKSSAKADNNKDDTKKDSPTATTPVVGTPITSSTGVLNTTGSSGSDRISGTTALHSESDSEELELLPAGNTGDSEELSGTEEEEEWNGDSIIESEGDASGIPVNVIIVGIFVAIALLALIVLSIKKKRNADVLED